jgi:uncharacterized protein YbjT (DUF2867 family)
MNASNGVALVTGASGTVGRHVVTELIRLGQRVRALSRSPALDLQTPGVEVVRFEYADPTTFETALSDVDRLFLLAPTGYVDSDQFTGAFLDLALARVEKVVAVTVQGADAGLVSSHYALEQRIERSGVPFVVLRPTWYADNFHTFWRPGIVRDGIIPLPASDSRTAFVDARDVASCAACALTTSDHDGRRFVLTGRKALTYGEAADVLSKASGRAIRYVDVPEDVFERDVVQAGMPPDYAKLIVGLLRLVRAGVTSELTAAVQNLTGAAPRSFEEYAAHYAAHWQIHPAMPVLTHA